MLCVRFLVLFFLGSVHGTVEELESGYLHGLLQETRHQTNYCIGECCDKISISKCSSSFGGLCYPPKSNVSSCDFDIKNACKNDNCKCCIDCSKNNKHTECRKVFGRCRKTCDVREYQKTEKPCHSSKCRCCKRCRTPSRCKRGRNPGQCIGDKRACNKPASYICKSHCKVASCICCRTCTPDASCTDTGGHCVKAGHRCPKNYAVYRCGCNSDRNCWCCVPVKKKGKFHGSCAVSPVKKLPDAFQKLMISSPLSS